MGKSPGKWIKTVLFGKKSSKSNLSKDATLEIKTSITAKAPPKDFDSDSIVISSPVPPVIDSSGDHTELEKSSSANLTCDTTGDVTNPVELNAANDDELIKLEQAAIKAQAAFRGYLARRAFWALKGIIRLQALVRGHLVRRQAVATLSCMRAIVEFQALVRGRRVRLSGNGYQMLQKYTPGEFVDKKRANLLLTSLRVEKLSTNMFGTKLAGSSPNTTPLTIQYDPIEPNSARSWLERWSVSSFWEPLPQPKKPLDAKPKRKPTKPQTEDTETGRPKRSVRRIPPANIDNNSNNNNNNNNHSSENEKSKRTFRKMTNPHQAEPVLEHSHNELERVKRSLRKISISTTPEKPDIVVDDKESTSLNPDISEHETDTPFVKNVKDPEPDAAPVESVDPPADDNNPTDVVDDNNPTDVKLEPNMKVENDPSVNVESNGKENLKTRRRKSLPVKPQEYNESSVSAAVLPSYMAATESAKAKLRAQAAAKAAEEGAAAENGFSRRHSLPSSTGKMGLHSPRVQKPLQVNGKGGNKSNKIAPRDEKVLQTGWRR